jgi:hypothetical protein
MHGNPEVIVVNQTRWLALPKLRIVPESRNPSPTVSQPFGGRFRGESDYIVQLLPFYTARIISKLALVVNAEGPISGFSNYRPFPSPCLRSTPILHRPETGIRSDPRYTDLLCRMGLPE